MNIENLNPEVEENAESNAEQETESEVETTKTQGKDVTLEMGRCPPGD